MRRRHHRQFGLPNANQILLCMAVCTLLFFSLLRHSWLQLLPDPEVYASLQRVYIVGEESVDSKSWETFCTDKLFTMTIPGTNKTTTVVNLQDGTVLCRRHTNGKLVPQLMVWMLATGLSCALLSTLLAAYLQLGNPTKDMIFWIGMMPSILLFGSAVLGTASLLVWQRYYGGFDNGDSFSITVAATVIAYASAFAMIIRWRWPGICAVPNEQQALGSRSYEGHLLPPRGRRRGFTRAINSPLTRDGESFAVSLKC